MEWLNYHHLLYFWMVAREGSIARAGEQLRLAQPTISGQIRMLEEQLGEKLFQRSGRNLVLTDVGRLVYRVRRSDLRARPRDAGHAEGSPDGKADAVPCRRHRRSLEDHRLPVPAAGAVDAVAGVHGLPRRPARSAARRSGHSRARPGAGRHADGVHDQGQGLQPPAGRLADLDLRHPGAGRAVPQGLSALAARRAVPDADGNQVPAPRARAVVRQGEHPSAPRGRVRRLGAAEDVRAGRRRAVRGADRDSG